MQTSMIKFEIEVEERWAKVYQRVTPDKQNRLLTELKKWLEQYLASFTLDIDKDDPWLKPVEDYAVDAGIEDFSLNHDHYLYVAPRKS
jgi:transposase